MYTLTYDLGPYDDETQCEYFDTIEDLLIRYEEIRYEVCEIAAWDENDKKIAPWFW